MRRAAQLVRRYSSAAAIPHGRAPVASRPVRGYGQPLPATHPHLLAPGELTPGISASEYEARRARLMAPLEPGAIVVLAAGKLKYMSANIFYKFRQTSNFWYLTGWEEPDSVLVLEKTSCARGFKMTLFCPSKDASDEVWNGPRSGREGAVDTFGADDAADIMQLTSRLKSMIQAPSTSTSSPPPIYADVPGISPSDGRSRISRPTASRSLFDYLVPSATSLSDFDDVAAVLNGEKSRTIKSAAGEVERLRIVKSEAEIKVMRRAADISSKAHAETMQFAGPTNVTGRTESSLVAHFEYITSLAGSPRAAYVPVVASGPSALTIHYTSNSLPLNSGDLVLLDAGCEYGGYASDITRTWPVSGTFTSAQRDLYEAVLRVEKDCIKLCSVSVGMSLDELHNKSCSLMREELTRLGFNLRSGEMERILYPHYLSHPLGIDLHDTPSFGRNEKLQAGMVITIEPGLYVPPNSSFPTAFHNMAVRVEDEVLVRAEDYIVLSVNAPKEVVDVEACCNK